MTKSYIQFLCVAIALTSAPVSAEEPLSLSGAVATALKQHPSMDVAAARIRAAEARIQQARGSYLPKVNFQESWARSNNPVFVFSSLLTQHQFTVDNFSLGPLNRPDALNNFQSTVSVDQVLYDAGQIRAGVKSAEIGRKMTDEERRSIRMNVIGGVVRSYYAAVLARQSLAAARESVRSAEADLERAQSIRQAGMSTDADVLSIRVHLATIREQQIRREADLEVASAALNEALGLPLDTLHQLSTSLERSTGASAAEAPSDARPEVRQALLAAQGAQEQVAAARGNLLPQVGLRGVFEADRQRFIDRGGANWMLAVSLKWNLFNGNSDRARIEEARQSLLAANAQKRQVDQAVRLQVRRAESDLRSAAVRVTVSSAVVFEAEESLRISKNRFGAGLSTVTDLLRTETALLDVRMRRLAAVYDERIAAVALEQAKGALSEDSPAVR
ncbi:MAG: TolC family protein [Acidobacteria bacterium]|nr:TolC family protein [Acidobacteriota bacterium]